jgi:hypothetical protein
MTTKLMQEEALVDLLRVYYASPVFLILLLYVRIEKEK